MLLYCFTYYHINYARYLTYFLDDMLQLNKSFPGIYEQVIVRNFAAQLSSKLFSHKLFSRIETDKVIQMTLNKDTKSPGGTTGFSTIVGVVQRCELNASYRESLRRCIDDHLQHEQNMLNIKLWQNQESVEMKKM